MYASVSRSTVAGNNTSYILNHAVLVQLDVVNKRRAAVQGEVQRVVQIVVQVRAGTDHEIDQPALHQLHDAAA